MIKTSALRAVCRHALRTQAQRNASTITAIKGREVRVPPSFCGRIVWLWLAPCRRVGRACARVAPDRSWRRLMGPLLGRR